MTSNENPCRRGPGLPEFIEECTSDVDGFGAEGGHVDPWSRGDNHGVRHHQGNSFKAHCKSNSRNGGTAELFDKAVIPSAGPDGILCAKCEQVTSKAVRQ